MTLQPIEIDVFLQKPVLVSIRAEDDTVQTLSLPRLGTDGLIPWLAEISEQRKAAFRASFAKLKLTPQQLADAEFSAEMNSRAVIRDLAIPAQTPEGIRRILTLSVASPKAAIDGKPIPAAQQPEIVDALMGSPLVSHISDRISCLFLTGEQRPKIDPEQAARDAAAKTFPGANIPDPLPVGGGSGPNTPAPESVTTG